MLICNFRNNKREIIVPKEISHEGELFMYPLYDILILFRYLSNKERYQATNRDIFFEKDDINWLIFYTVGEKLYCDVFFKLQNHAMVTISFKLGTKEILHA